jgi:hypothetical protein
LFAALSVVLICASVPVSATVPVPLPATAAPPADATVSVPCSTASVAVIVPAPASTSAIDSPAIAAGVFASTSCDPGTPLTGASFTGVMSSVAVVATGAATPSVTA